MKLSFLDFGFRYGGGPGTAIQKSVEYAQAIERHGFHGIALSEHYDRNVGWGSCIPAMSMIAENTQRIHVSSAGVLLLAHNVLSLVSDFALLQARHEGRISLGVARGRPSLIGNRKLLCGSDEQTYDASFEEKLHMLFYLLRGNKYQESLSILPSGFGELPVQLLGTGKKSWEMATRYQAPYVHSLFHRSASSEIPAGTEAIAIAGIPSGCDNVVERYFPTFVSATILGERSSLWSQIEAVCCENNTSNIIFLDCSDPEGRLANLDALAHERDRVSG